METDYNSIKSVCSIMEHTGLTKFLIFRLGSTNRNTTAVFEHVGAGSSSKAIDAFRKWGAAIENSNPYEMWLFDDYKDYNEGAKAEDTKQAYTKKTGLIKFSFCLKPEVQPAAAVNGNSLSTKEIVEQVIAEMEEKRKADTNNQRFDALNAKLDAFMNGADDEEEEEASPTGNAMIAQLITLAGAFGLIPKQGASPAINGTAEQNVNIVKAIEILTKNDAQIDTDLLKLASLSESNKPLFDVLIGQLRSMK